MKNSINTNTASDPYISEYAVLIKKMRIIRKLRRKQAAHFLPFDHKNIEKLENGRVTLTEKKIRHIVETYGFTMELFQQLLKQSLLRHEIIEQCQELVERLDENKLRVILPMLQSMANN